MGRPELEQLVDVCDRLVVDSSEWRGLPRAYAELARLFDRIAVSDIAWGRGLGWRGRLASLWPGIADAKRLSVTGPKADALLLAGWLRSRLGTRLSLTHRSAGALERVLVDGEPVGRRAAARRARATCSRPSSTSSAATRSTKRQAAVSAAR